MSEKKEEKKEKEIKARVFHIVQRVRHEETNEELLTRDKIIQGLGHKGIKLWAFILHDKDIDENGNLKSPHWHIVIYCPNQVKLKSVSQWFGVAENFIDLPKGRGAFEDCVAYLTHEEVKGDNKYIYEYEEISANFDVEEFFKNRLEEKAKYGTLLMPEEKIMADVLYNGMTLLHCRKNYKYEYIRIFEKLKKCRADYLSQLPPPQTRINFYIEGEGGIGKGLFSRALALSFFNDYEDETEIFFEVGAENVTFEGYDGQPVVIWNDCRAYDLLKKLGGRDNVFNVFDTHPTSQKQNIKYSSTVLQNTINIVNSPQPYTEFLDSLAGEYVDRRGEKRVAEDKKQSYRRFPIMIVIHENYYEMLMNKGYLDGTKEYTTYVQYGKIRGNMQKIAEKTNGNINLRNKLNNQVVSLATEKGKYLLEREKEIEINEEEVLKEFEEYGKTYEEEFIEVTEDMCIPFE